MKTPFRALAQLIKWTAIPVLSIASMFSYLTVSYEPLFVGALTLGAIVLVERAVRSREYCWAVGLGAIVVVFSPLLLMAKVFALMGLTCIAAFVTLLAAFRTRPAPADSSQEF